MTASDTPASAPQVVIVGGGPVGMGLAIDLGQRGVRCTVVERYPEPQPIPKGQNLTQRTLEHFHFWGAEAALRAARTIPRDYGIGGLTAYGTLLGGYAYDWLQRELVRPYYFTDNERLPQYATEAVLRRRAAAIPAVETLYGWTAEDVGQDEAGVRVTVARRDGSGRRTLRAPYGVGCDGSRSLMRERAGITQTRQDHDRVMVLLVFRSEGLHALLERFPGKSFYNVLHPDLEGYWQFFGRVDLGTTWFFHAPVPPGTTRDNFDFPGLLHAAVGAPFDVALEHVGFWDLRFATADSYRHGRLFVAGDAAHSHPPYGGYGINTGFEDAANLGWKLAAALAGWAGPGLLDSYTAERRPVFASTARDFIERAIRVDRDFLAAHDPARDRAAFEEAWQARQSGARSEVGAYAPHYSGSPLVAGPPGAESGALGTHAFAARAGHHLAPLALSSGRSVYEALGAGFTLLALGGDGRGARAFREAAGRLGIPLTVVEDARDGEPARYEAGLVLVRPDQFVAWAGDDAVPDAAAILGRAVGHADGGRPDGQAPRA
ncbi:4-methyl-5-nitrocatechol 5-monooxygenase [Methylobacterium crusticola]|uniref:4-methyl-5-nitrocatechol 5-monooxygenase n=1 Tax=Methylobacterium crusticola TaxID=1697972 RepID=A0ABQ4R5I6_9HYPH|nr:FAD-dependent monooxygenase [Methylobacterium crusticola]GJD52571.1 4-methyl-5-nitrocatechol 5-monooxygenase [Methylobacterium crusticola]